MGRTTSRKSRKGRRGTNNLDLIDRGQAGFKDRGCRVWHACLSCPLPRCALEMPAFKVSRVARTVRVAERLFAGESQDQILAAEGISRRTYYRIRKDLLLPLKAA